MSEEEFPQRPWALPPDATEVVLVRHGASMPYREGTSFDLVDGHADPPLAPEGLDQAERVGRRLAGAGLSALFVTPLQRTQQTAAPLAAATRLELTVIPALREVHLGAWEGGELRARAARRDPVALKLFSEERWCVIPGAEKMASLAERCHDGVTEIVARSRPGTSVGAFVHGGVIGELCRQATNSRPFAFVHADNGSITRLVVLGDGRWLLRSFNDISHL